MKKNAFVFAIICLIFASCTNQKKEPAFVPGVLIYEEGSLWTENENGTMRWNCNIAQGTSLNLYPESEKMAVRDGTTGETEFVKLCFNNSDYWIQTAIIAKNCKPALVLDDTVVYSTPELTGVSSVKVPANTIVAVDESYTTPIDSEIDFKKVTFRTDKNYRSCYIKSDSISGNNDDVTLIRILNKFKVLKNDEVKKEMLINAKKLYPSPSVKTLLNKTIEESFPELSFSVNLVETTEEPVEEIEEDVSNEILEDETSEESENNDESYETNESYVSEGM